MKYFLKYLVLLPVFLALVFAPVAIGLVGGAVLGKYLIEDPSHPREVCGIWTDSAGRRHGPDEAGISNEEVCVLFLYLTLMVAGGIAGGFCTFKLSNSELFKKVEYYFDH